MKTYGKVWRYPANDFGNEAWGILCEPHVAEKLKRWFRQIAANREGTIILTDTREVGRDLVWFLERYPMEISLADRRRLKKRAREYDETRATVERILAGERLTADGWLEPALPPKKFQLTAADMALSLGRLLIGDDVGLGKSFSALLLLRNPDALPALVVCQTHVQRQWLRELAKFFPMLRGHIVRQCKVYDPSQTRDMCGHHPDVLIMSYAKLDAWAAHLAGQVQTVIFDETQELRKSGSFKYAAAGRVADSAPFAVGTTATPVYNYGGEIHNVIQVLKRDALGTRDEFVRAWGSELGNGRVGVRDPRALGSHLRDEGLLLRRTRKDVGEELPDVIRIPHDVEADQRTYEREIEAGGVEALAELILSGAGDRKERWRASGEIDWQLRRATGLAKAPYVAGFVDMLLESERKVVLAGWHRDVYDVWRTMLAAHGPVLYTGTESPAAKDRNAQRFIEDDDTRVMLMSLRSGVGLDGLQQVCKVVAFGELDWSPGIHDQVIGRLNRDGMDVSEPVVAYFLTCDFGSDPAVMDALGIKRAQAELIRDPDAQLFDQAAPDAADRVRRLAQQVLARRGKQREAA